MRAARSRFDPIPIELRGGWPTGPPAPSGWEARLDRRAPQMGRLFRGGAGRTDLPGQGLLAELEVPLDRSALGIKRLEELGIAEDALDER